MKLETFLRDCYPDTQYLARVNGETFRCFRYYSEAERWYFSEEIQKRINDDGWKIVVWHRNSKNEITEVIMKINVNSVRVGFGNQVVEPLGDISWDSDNG